MPAKPRKTPRKTVAVKTAKPKKTTPPKDDATAVAAYMTALKHPLKAEIEAVRTIIKNAHPDIAERIKWNAPSYHSKEDMVTFHVRPQDCVHLVFHHPAIVTIASPLLTGDYKDRRMLMLKDMKAVRTHAKELTRILQALVKKVHEH
ncbi:DUF1801 domain-containing protein [Chryseolinea lacunae]|uniref:DUF1801 domain-containing protein n=1 Tax=Chryseolinea lacunae TaxID=2801331 RepID=A0ABS1KVF5_9BACT|nr:DUF1801 domain-containing protein [Chryseolinea lacunae]MBL0743444.1 DUF1801 domain-containing protein [Chryseolinea lacunae]